MALIRFYKPTLRRKDMDAVLQTMVDEKIGPGDRKKEFLKQISLVLNKKDGIALRSYADALKFALKATGIEAGDKVAVSVLSPLIYKSVAKELGIKLILCDIDEKTGCMSLSESLKALEDGAKLLLVHSPVCQLPTNLLELKADGITIIEDVSESFGSKVDITNEDKTITFKAGDLGTIVISSLEEEGVVSSAGGAVVLSNDEEIISNLKESIKPYSPYIELSDMNAALGIIQVLTFEELLYKRNDYYNSYKKEFSRGNNHELFGTTNISFLSNGFNFPIVCKGNPEEVIQFSEKYSVSVKRTFKNSLGWDKKDKYEQFPKANAAINRGLSFPLYPFLEKREIDTILRVLSHLP